MSLMRRYGASLLLAVMTFAIAPQGWLHACEHGIEVAHADQERDQLSTSCGACAMGMLVATEPPSAELPLVAELSLPLTASAVAGTTLGFTLLAADRGPPVRC